jgi:hypothetical protein
MMEQQNNPSRYYLYGTHEAEFLQDLHDLTQEQDFGVVFVSESIHSDHCSPLRIKVLAGDLIATVFIAFREYPSKLLPVILPREGKDSCDVVNMVNRNLYSEAGSGSLIGLPAVVASMRKAADELSRNAGTPKKKNSELAFGATPRATDDLLPLIFHRHYRCDWESCSVKRSKH